MTLSQQLRALAPRTPDPELLRQAADRIDALLEESDSLSMGLHATAEAADAALDAVARCKGQALGTTAR